MRTKTTVLRMMLSAVNDKSQSNSTMKKGLDKHMETTALMLKIIGAIIQITSIAYTITAIAKKKRKHIWIGIALFVIAFLLLNQATHMEDRLRGGY
ncbi:hypothetical protein [Paenibacillus polymyxa]|uniref:hypothetical protein n=1 Tax=Paenibacillus polymyxa TaxID=1406 RepID=UPI0021E46D86|nr:hypothetical protein [Paenibacillus polymyxa]